MKYLENAIKFLLKYWILAVPLFILTAIASLVSNAGISAAQFNALWAIISNPSQLADPGNLLQTLPTILPAIAGGGILAFLFQFISMPATYGLVNKGLETGAASLNDLGSAITLNVVKYIMYFIGTLVLGIAIVIVFFIVAVLLGLILSLLGGFGEVLLTLVILAYFCYIGGFCSIAKHVAVCNDC
jgi:hypothetical protein